MTFISYAITVCTEHAELDRLLDIIVRNKQASDEIVVQCDKGNTTKEVYEVLKKYYRETKVVEFPLGRNIASFKNNLKKNCTGQWIIQIDADELPSDGFWDYINPILQSNRGLADTMYIGRRNTVSGLTEEHIQKWGWKITERDGEQLVNYPDYQHRIFRNNGKIKWINKVHEKLDGYGSFSLIPAEEVFLWHRKDIKRQEKQNAFYESL
jgi:glycosyltransferase involved in cell wall biosynthesis